MNEPIRIAVVDDQPLMRKVVCDKLHLFDEISLAIQATNGRDLLNQLANNPNVDLILMDVQMDEMDGVEATQIVKSNFPHIKVLMLSVFDDDHSVFEAIKAGAEGYLLKDIDAKGLHQGIVDTMKGGAAMTPSIAIKVLKYLKQQTTEIPEKKESFSLSKRETEVLELLSKGLTYKHISEQLFLSPHTVRKHIDNIYHKLNACSKIEAINIARNNRLI
ncbi:MAG: response regulator transcription factor [Crocinitomicaceae bacterium]|jgi:DNA-binding NarL/FixJ family response regulator|nr:response regulator transcription factor [Crocinitomicaceae bacterium]